MKHPFMLLSVGLGMVSCRPTTFEDYVYDFQANKPLAGVLVRSTTGKTYTNSAGYFSLPRDGQTLELVLTKAGYLNDTVGTMTFQAGEMMADQRLGTDTIYMFRVGSTFRDSIADLNSPR